MINLHGGGGGSGGGGGVGGGGGGGGGRRGMNPQPPVLQSDSASNWVTETYDVGTH